MIFYVYIVFRLDGMPCYVGKGSGSRAYSSARGYGTNPHLKLIALAAPDRTLPVVIIRHGLSEADAFAFEAAWISALGRADTETGVLVNFTDGGEGLKGRVVSEKTKKAISKSNIGRVFSDEHKARISIGLLTSPNRHKLSQPREKSEAERQKLSKSLSGNKFSEQHIAALSESRRKSEPTIAHCREIAAKGAAAIAELWKDPVAAARMLVNRVGKKRTAETRSRISKGRTGVRLSAEVKLERKIRMAMKRAEAEDKLR